VGRFIEQAKKLEYFQNTLFVFVGDHGFHVEPKLTETHLLYHHVPLLFYSPGLLSKSGEVVSSPASQLDIVPTIMELVEANVPHSSWGRDLFSRERNGDGVVTFKGSGGSGSDQAVALIRGDKMLVVGSNGKPSLWSYRLNPEPSVTPLEDPASLRTANAMQLELFGFVQAAANDLSIKTVTPPDSLLHPIPAAVPPPTGGAIGLFDRRNDAPIKGALQ
jgi:phosphoglycerol transferase MdoB-like AlkP superfamily enzyme